VAKRKKSEAFDVKMTAQARKDFASDLCTEIEDAISARATMIADGGLIDLCDWFYEQGRTQARDLPFPGAADLTSYLITQDVDALRARLMKAIFGVTPLCFVEGWGKDAEKAPFVEAFMDWQVRKSTLKADLAKTVHGALIEDAYILEVSEKVETRRITETIDVAIELDPVTGTPLFAGGNPVLKKDDDGEPIVAQEGEPAATVERTYTKTKRLGPQYDPISMKEFVFLPGHAKSSRQVWGYAYRIWARVPELNEQVLDGIYDKAAVEALGTDSDRDGTQQLTPTEVAPQIHAAAEKDLFQVSLKRDLDGDGREEWYVATVSVRHRELLRLKLDTFVMKVGRPRCVPFVLFPRRNAVYGYSFAGDKLGTLAEEHTALRNMKADRGALATNKPIMQMQGGLWNADVQPFGVGRVITVRDQHELKEFDVADVPTSIVEQEYALITANERVSGLSDTAAVGTQARQSNTLGQDQMISRASAVRVDEIIGYLHAAIADVMTLSHAIWVETLGAADAKGLDAPPNVLQALQGRQLELPDGKFTSAQLKGEFRFEPYGSDETADPSQRQALFNNKFVALANLVQTFPMLQALFQNPETTKAILEEWLRAYNVRDRQPFLGALVAPPLPPGSGPGLAPPLGQPSAAGLPPGGAPDLAAVLAMISGGNGGSGQQPGGAPGGY
jgi:hypothetical protein